MADTTLFQGEINDDLATRVAIQRDRFKTTNSVILREALERECSRLEKAKSPFEAKATAE